VTKQIPSYLKLVTDTNAETPAVASEDLAVMADVARTFTQATGWRLSVDAPAENSSLMWSAPVNPGVGNSPGHIGLFHSSDGPDQRIDLEDAAALADSLGKLWGELISTRRALWQREAELAAGVPLVLREDEHTPPLSERLEAVLRGGAEAVGCDAAALYMLDPATTELKLRSSWGLPQKRLAEPARPLRGSVADLEALLGHAVVLTDSELHNYWKVPESGFAACVCVPVSSPTIPLGTLWFFSRQEREFTDPQTNILEVVAGRIASDLEREVLADEALLSREQTKQVVAAQQSQHDQLPTIAPLIDGWDVAACTSNSRSIGGTFYDWFALDDGSLSVLAGDSVESGVAGALTAAALRATARAIAPSRKAANKLLDKANSILWTGSAGNQRAGLFQAVLMPHAKSAQVSTAGPLRVLAIGGDEIEIVGGPAAPLGWQDDRQFDAIDCELPLEQLLLVYGTGYLAFCDELTLRTLDTQLALALRNSLHRPAAELVELADDVLGDFPGIDSGDRVMLVIKRRGR
jgi:sigma-B regulation protein RsbU (phosphoserine phosphatase)